MSKFLSEKYASLSPYTPGEQPQDRKYLKLNTNESPFPPSPFASRFAREEAGNLQLYSDPQCRALVRTAAEKLGLAENEILFTNGSDEILYFAFSAFCDQNTPAVFPDITYGFYKVFAEFVGVPYEQIPLKDDFSVDTEKFCGINKTVFIANPNAPTGVALSVSSIEKIVVSNPDNMVVIDEAYVDFGGESVLPLIHKYNNLLVCRTFSKSRSLAGARLGFGAANADVLADLNAVKYSINPYNVNRMTMAAGIGALEDSEYFEKNRAEIIKVRKWTQTQLESLGFSMPDSSANFLFAKKEGVSGKEIYLRLKEKGVLIRHFEADRLCDYNRITIGSREQMETFVKRLKEVLEELK